MKRILIKPLMNYSVRCVMDDLTFEQYLELLKKSTGMHEDYIRHSVKISFMDAYCTFEEFIIQRYGLSRTSVYAKCEPSPHNLPGDYVELLVRDSSCPVFQKELRAEWLQGIYGVIHFDTAEQLDEIREYLGSPVAFDKFKDGNLP